MEVETAVVRRLRLDPEAALLRGMVGDRIYKRRLQEPLDGGRAVVARRNGGWTTPEVVTTQEFPELILAIWADPDVDGDGLPLSDTAEPNAWAVYRLLRPLFHYRRHEWWGAGGSHQGLMVVSSDLELEPTPLFRPGAVTLDRVQQTDEGAGSDSFCLRTAWQLVTAP